MRFRELRRFDPPRNIPLDRILAPETSSRAVEVEVENTRAGERKTLPGDTIVTLIPDVPRGERYPARETWEQKKLADVAPGRKVILSASFRRSGLAGSFMTGDESLVVVGPPAGSE